MAETVIIVGAPRSGTNMLRDVLTSLEGFATWPCDEINPIWRHGNLNIPHDELKPEHARPQVRDFLRRQFESFGRRTRTHTVVEKTCATSLRVAFAHTVFPDAKFIFIRRDGLDAAASTMKRWNAPFDLQYTLKKVRWVPKGDLVRHLGTFTQKKIAQRLAGDSGQEGISRTVKSWWGPRPHDYQALMEHHPLEELALIQWNRCVEMTLNDFDRLPQAQMIEVKYEEFVRDPASGTRTVLEFLRRPEAFSPSALTNVRESSVGKGRTAFSADVLDRMESMVRPTLARLGY